MSCAILGSDKARCDKFPGGGEGKCATSGTPTRARLIGLALLALAIPLYPLLASVTGRPWSEAEIFGIAPDPMAIGTLGFLLLARSRRRMLRLPIPLLWCAASSVTLLALGAPAFWVPVMAAAMAFFALFRPGPAQHEAP